MHAGREFGVDEFFDRALQLINLGRFERAEQEIGRALEHDPEDVGALSLLAYCRGAQLQFPEAREIAARVLQLEPDMWFAHYVRGKTFAAEGRFEEALEACGEALNLRPEAGEIWLVVAEVHMDAARHTDALEAIERVLELVPASEEGLGYRAMTLSRLGRFDEARQAVRDALDADPASALARCAAGSVALDSGRADEAREHYAEALGLDPTSDGARLGLAIAIKATHPLMRVIARVWSWITPLGTWFQVALILVAGTLVVVLRELQGEASPHVSWLAPTTYTFVAVLAVLWLALPLSDAALRFHPVGRHALDRWERIQSTWTAGSIGVGIASSIAVALGASGGFESLAVYALLLPFPLAAVRGCRENWAIFVQLLVVLGVTLFGLAAVGLRFVGTWVPTLVSFADGCIVAYAWAALGGMVLGLLLAEVPPSDVRVVPVILAALGRLRRRLEAEQSRRAAERDRCEERDR